MSVISETSNFVGVSWNIKKKKWQARVLNKKNMSKYFDNEIEAAKFYDDLIRKCEQNKNTKKKVNFPRNGEEVNTFLKILNIFY